MSRYFKKYALLTLPAVALVMEGCAAGSATAGYALKASSADSLSSSGEQRIVERIKKELIAEMGIQTGPLAPVPVAQ